MPAWEVDLLLDFIAHETAADPDQPAAAAVAAGRAPPADPFAVIPSSLKNLL